jgi:type IV pilus assembly protein PilA
LIQGVGFFALAGFKRQKPARFCLTLPAPHFVGKAGSYFKEKPPAMKTHLPKKLKNQKGFTLIELLIVIAIIGILATVAFPQFTQYRNRSFGAAVTADLKNAYLACTIFWGTGLNTNVTPCTNDVAGIQGPLYSFLPTNNVAIVINNGTEAAFNSTGTHTSLLVPLVTWTLGPNGAITNDGGL